MRIWWGMARRGAIYGIAGGHDLGGVAGAIAGATGHLPRAPVCGHSGGFIAGLAASMFALKQALTQPPSVLVALSLRFRTDGCCTN